jgi:hypothetical protein
MKDEIENQPRYELSVRLSDFLRPLGVRDCKFGPLCS